MIPKKRDEDARKSFNEGKALIESAIKEGNIWKKIENDNFLSGTRDPRDIKGHMTAEECNECHISERVKAFRYKPLIHGGAQ